MGLWMLLLLHVHLGNAPWIEEVCASLPAPTNVSISSLNMEHTLSFLPGPETPSSARFTVEIRCFSARKISWRRVAGCLKLTAGQTCNLTQAFDDQFDQYQARVRAFTSNQKSNWTVSERFNPMTDTVLEPPDMSVSGCGNCLFLQLSPRTNRVLPLIQYAALIFHVKRTRDSAQFKLTLDFKEELTIMYLEPGVEYCVTVTVKSPLIKTESPSSEPHCALTSPPLPTSSMYVVYSLLGAFCFLGFLLLGLVVYDGQLSIRLLRQRLPRTLTYVIFQGQNCRRSPPGSSSHISAMQLHKEGSADCLLTAHRPDQLLEGSREEGEEDVDCQSNQMFKMEVM